MEQKYRLERLNHNTGKMASPKLKIDYYCPHCGQKVIHNKNLVVKGYFATCINCDEDFYKFELNIKNK